MYVNVLVEVNLDNRKCTSGNGVLGAELLPLLSSLSSATGRSGGGVVLATGSADPKVTLRRERVGD